MNKQLHSNTLFAGKPYDALFENVSRPIIIADSLRNADNIGALIRLADNVGAARLWLLGKAESINATKIKRAAASSYGNIQWGFTETTDIKSLVPKGYTIVALETAHQADNLFQTALPTKMALIVGNEVNGIRPEILSQASKTVYIPIPGPTKSMNVSHAAAVCAFEWLRQMLNNG